MIDAALWAAVTGGTGPERFGLDGVAAVVAVLGGAVGVWLSVVKVIEARRARLSGDEKEVRMEERADIRDAIARRDAWIVTLTEERDKARSERDRAIEQRDTAREECDEQREDFRRYQQSQDSALMGHVPWDVTAHGIALEAGKPIGLPPPLRPPPGWKEDH